MSKVKIAITLLVLLGIVGYANYESFRNYNHRANGIRYLCIIAEKDIQASPERDEFLKTCK